MTDIDTGRTAARRVLASRRGLMCGLAGLGAAGALAACGTAEPAGDSDEDDGETGTDTGGESGGDVLAPTSEVPVGGGIIVGETVIVQPTEDEFMAFSAACPHMETIVDPPNEDGVIVCPNHRSEFDMEGGLLKGPAETGLTEVAITVENGEIALA